MASNTSPASVPPIRVMIVDDSAIVRGLLQRALKEVPDIEIAASACNGNFAIEKLRNIHIDIILLDIEMPEMDGMTALPQLLKISSKTRIIMVSTLTLRNAEISLHALELGAADYITKPSTRTDKSVVDLFYRELIEKIHALAPKASDRKAVTGTTASITTPASHAPFVSVIPKLMLPTELTTSPKYPLSPVQAIAIGSSTGGPQALSVLFKGLAVRFPKIPIFITQHMPPNFTTILAKQIEANAGNPCTEAVDGEIVQAGHIYVAPGDYHMVPTLQGGKVIIRLNQQPPVNFCRPSVDPMLHALSAIYGSHLLTVILTGMGSDGLGGARDVVAARGTVIAQNEETSVVWGMPRAVAEHNLCSAVLPLDNIAPYLLKALT